MEEAKRKQLKRFVKQWKSDPSILTDPSLSFFRKYLESLGTTVPSSASKIEDSKSKGYTVEESDDDMSEEEVPVKEEEEAEIIVASHIQLEGNVVEPDNESPQKMALRSLYLMMNYASPYPYVGCLAEIDMNKLEPSKPAPFDFVARFIPGPEGGPVLNPIQWRACYLGSDNLCLLPDIFPDAVYVDSESESDSEVLTSDDLQLNGYIFNIRTRKVVQRLKPPQAPKFCGHVVFLNGKIYFIADTYWSSYLPDPSFERYDPIKDTWETLAPFPYDKKSMAHKAEMVAYAVFDDFILFNIDYDTSTLWAYDESSNKWYPVTVDDHDCLYLQGLGVVVENTLYTLTSLDVILALTVTREQSDDGGDVVFTCSLQSKFSFPYESMTYPHRMQSWAKYHLVHFGGDKEFCLVRCGLCFNDSGLCCNVNDHQHLQLILFQLKEEEEHEDGNVSPMPMTVNDVLEYQLDLLGDKTLTPIFCFSLPPGCGDFVKRKEDFSDIDFIVNPIFDAAKQGTVKRSKNLAASDESKDVADTTTSGVQKEATMKSYESVADTSVASSSSVPLSRRNDNTHKEGHSIYVSNLPPGATVEQLEKEFKKFGSIKLDGIQVKRNEYETYGFVEFESVTSMYQAIEASPITIRNRRAEIKKKIKPTRGGSGKNRRQRKGKK